MENNDLWPDFKNIPKVISPRSIMAEQAKFLSEKTKNLLTANIISGNSSANPGKIYNQFSIIAPLLKNYNYLLFTLYHEVFLYPCEIKFEGQVTSIADEEKLKSALQQIFNSPSTKKVITSLLSQSMELDTKENETN